ncbi:MAG: [Fe-Fe] hydrogenase large subunit C-terminal domain-containing protein [Victivallaceae bacterium]
MNHSYPIYTVSTECQDCYKCVRHCPVKAIKVEDGRATVIPELCVACGRCVEICPSKAKKVRDDQGRAENLLTQTDPVYVSLAPSWVSEFQGICAGRMIAALKLLGFAEISETALGAQAVTAETAKLLRNTEHGAVMSSACPVTVDYIRRYLPEFTGAITGLFSPALSHAKMLKDKYGNNIKVVFIGPCIAKKNEADRHPELLSMALTFTELRNWLKNKNIDLYKLEVDENSRFVPDQADEGAMYPIEGGMIRTLEIEPELENVHFAALTGLENIGQALRGLRPQDVKETVFIECLACYGGCVHGPCTQHASPGLLERLRIVKGCKIPEKIPVRALPVKIDDTINEERVEEEFISLQAVKQALRSIGKMNADDELNCGGCGYDTCQNFARALIMKKGEPSMCVSYLRKQAQKKANALLRCIPSGVVIADKNLNVIECNRRFAELFGETTLLAFDARPGLAGADLKRLVPFAGLFENSLATGRDIKRDSYRLDNRLFNITIFSIEATEVVGAVIADVTSAELKREQIAKRARDVIDKNLATVQDIACKLGEHMAETEILLRSIANDYADDKLLDDMKKEKMTGEA